MDEKFSSNQYSANLTQRRTGLASEMLGMLREHKKWWLTPIIITALLFGLLILLSGTGAAPFIYTLF